MLHQAENASSIFVQIPRFGAVLLVTLLLLTNLLSLTLQDSNPQAAVQFAPYNSAARLNHSVSRLQQEENDDYTAIRSSLTIGAKLSPIDARFLSLLGVVELRTGNDENADQLFTESLKQLPTEIQALVNKIAIAVSEEDYDQAALYADMIARRWKNQWPAIETNVQAALSTPQGVSAFSERFGEFPESRKVLIENLAQSPETLTPAYRLLASWHAKDVPGLQDSTNLVTHRLLGSGQSGLAYALFRQTAPAGTLNPDNLLNNGDFAYEPTFGAFDWSVTPQSGVSFDWSSGKQASKGLVGQVDDNPDGQLRIRFLDSPIRFDNIRQTTMLGPGKYNLEASFSTSNFEAPKPIKMAIDCKKGKTRLAEIEFSETNGLNQTISTSFSVPDTDCSTQSIYAFNDELTESWRNRYKGILVLDRVSIQIASE